MEKKVILVMDRFSDMREKKLQRCEEVENKIQPCVLYTVVKTSEIQPLCMTDKILVFLSQTCADCQNVCLHSYKCEDCDSILCCGCVRNKKLCLDCLDSCRVCFVNKSQTDDWCYGDTCFSLPLPSGTLKINCNYGASRQNVVSL